MTEESVRVERIRRIERRVKVKEKEECEGVTKGKRLRRGRKKGKLWRKGERVHFGELNSGDFTPQGTQNSIELLKQINKLKTQNLN